MNNFYAKGVLDSAQRYKLARIPIPKTSRLPERLKALGWFALPGLVGGAAGAASGAASAKKDNKSLGALVGGVGGIPAGYAGLVTSLGRLMPPSTAKVLAATALAGSLPGIVGGLTTRAFKTNKKKK